MPCDSTHRNPRKAGIEATFAASVDAALSDLRERIPSGLNPLERAEEARLRQALQRLLECADELADAELIVPGSTGQARAHPLIAVERDLRREVSESLRQLIFRADGRATVERINDLTRDRPTKAEDQS